MATFNFERSTDEQICKEVIDKITKETEKKMAQLVKEAKKRQVVELKLTDEQVKGSGEIRHRDFDKVAFVIRKRLPAFLYGGAGNGKSKIAEQIAEMLKIPYYSISVSYQTSVGQLVGYMDAQGHYVRTLLREAYENGGVFCIDEIDAGNQNVIMCLNAITNQDICAFPDGMVKKHKNFVVVATANTKGDGSDLQYSGRERIDAALLSRFVKIHIDYDENLERQLVAQWAKPEFVDEIMAFAQQQRSKTRRDDNILWTPRQSVFVARLSNDLGLTKAFEIVSEQKEV